MAAADDPVRRLRAALASLDGAIGTVPYTTLIEHGDDGRLSRSTVARLRQSDSTVLPLWSTVGAFVLACLAYADDQSIAVPEPLRDLGYWQRLHDECRAARGGNVVTGSVSGSVVQARDIYGDIHVGGAGPMRSAYLEQVARIAPDHLYDRDAELAELAQWCVHGDTAYAWWRGPAWTCRQPDGCVIAPPG